MKDYIEPTIGSGFRDYLPEDMIPRQRMLDIIRGVFERFGFLPLDTPAIEREEILTGGDSDFKKQIFHVGHEHGGEEFALRFDLTVPLARVISMNREIERPFKRYQMGKVWRGEKPQAGRYREFIQFDADIVGSSSLLADAEIIALVYATMTALGFSKFMIKVNNRKILNALPEYAKFNKESMEQVLRSIDKLDKIGWEEVSKEIQAKTDLNGKEISLLKEFIELNGNDQDSTLERIELLMKDSTTAQEGIRELKKIRSYLKSFGVSDSNWTIDFSVARGLGYYTGIVFETQLTDLSTIGSVFSGGRYDNLVARFSPQSAPATGASIGVDRLFAAMEQLDLVKRTKSLAQVLVLNFDSVAEGAAVEVVSDLRVNNISAEIYTGKEETLKGQLGYALKREIPIVIIIGEDEKNKGIVQIKNLSTRNQIDVPLNQVVQKVNELLIK